MAWGNNSERYESKILLYNLIMITDQLLAKYPIISDQVDAKELGVLLRELEKVLQSGAAGNIVEFGCYVGTTSLFIRRLLDAYDFTGEFHVYDSFMGLPEKTQLDASLKVVRLIHALELFRCHPYQDIF